MNKSKTLKWLSDKPNYSIPVSFGVPWKKGELKDNEHLALVGEDGNVNIHNHYNMAFWSDGSVKWTGHNAFIETPSDNYRIIKVEQSAPTEKMAYENDSDIIINTGKIKVFFSKYGRNIIKKIIKNNTEILTDFSLTAVRENRIDDGFDTTVRYEHFVSEINSAVIEQDNGARCTIVVSGQHKYSGCKYPDQRTWLPFKLRFYLYKNCDRIKIVHTFFFDGNAHEDFIKGLGIKFCVPMRGDLYNRFIRMSGEKGFFTESPKQLSIMQATGKYADMLKNQIAGKTNKFENEDEAFITMLDESATWNDFLLLQDSVSHYSIRKRTHAGCAYITAVEGCKSNGFMYCGSDHGGVGLGIKDFWQKHPSAYDLKNTATDTADITAWLWSPYGEAMDLRHYDNNAHRLSSYEGYDELRSTPYGIANTNEMYLWLCDSTPSHKELKMMEKEAAAPTSLYCTPECYKEAEAFGKWSLANRATELGSKLEDAQDRCVQLYKDQISNNNWYGFWNYGDVMRFYDDIRHTWKYDVGGCAWNNNELVPDMWMWYSFLRSGREDIFRMAEAYTRHSSEVDQYHFGEYKGLGSRHNIIHWGCGCKEPRISMAGLNRFMYYITTDERIGEILDEVADADYTTTYIDPMRTVCHKDNHPTHVRISPDWAAFTSNWMTKWERYQDKTYRDKIIKGIACIKKFPYQLNSGLVCGYNPATNELTLMDAEYSFHMGNCFGTISVWLELAEMLDDEEFKDMLADYGAFYPLSLDEKQKTRPDITSNNNYGMITASAIIAAFAAKRLGDKSLATLAWNLLKDDRRGIMCIKEKQIVEDLAIPKQSIEYSGMESGLGLFMMNGIFVPEYLNGLIDLDL